MRCLKYQGYESITFLGLPDFPSPAGSGGICRYQYLRLAAACEDVWEAFHKQHYVRDNECHSTQTLVPLTFILHSIVIQNPKPCIHA